jgi:hypothetical protein
VAFPNNLGIPIPLKRIENWREKKENCMKFENCMEFGAGNWELGNWELKVCNRGNVTNKRGM